MWLAVKVESGPSFLLAWKSSDGDVNQPIKITDQDLKCRARLSARPAPWSQKSWIRCVHLHNPRSCFDSELHFLLLPVYIQTPPITG